ncbi:MAG: hypothetical protein GWO38_23220 [Phycisphaerae bacterium]|nr:hypothetical protein [Phycisphaerae bacterium]NIP54459.1 hypothetical protein [Phycisphaerae bacterium]NIX01523.1 hypothetical protein [Phycisphaerae bacterium]NIX30466.1 hypothetical protein [Phycisphaerae bacterium]
MKKAKLPDTKYLGCDLYIEVDEEHEGQAEDYARICAEGLRSIEDMALNPPFLSKYTGE